MKRILSLIFEWKCKMEALGLTKSNKWISYLLLGWQIQISKCQTVGMMMINVWWCWECFYDHCYVSQMHKLRNVWWQKLFQTQYLVYHTYICTILTYVLEILGQIYKYSFSCTRYIQVYTKSFNLQIKEHRGCPWIC